MMRCTRLVILGLVVISVSTRSTVGWECPAFAGLVSSMELQDEGSVETPSGVRRIHVPEEMIGRLARGYLPMAMAEFVKRFESLKAHASPFSPMSARIEQAQYFAVLHDNELIDGRARLEVTRADGPTMAMPMAHCNFALSNTQWLSEEQPAVVGLDPAGRLVAMVPQSGTLAFAWSLRADEEATVEGHRFTMQMPPSPFTQLFVATLPTADLRAEGGILTRISPAGLPDWALPDADQTDYAIWRIELGGGSELVLDVRPRTSAVQNGPFVLSSQQTRYTIAPSSVEVIADLELEIHHAAINQLIVRLDRPLKPIQARLGDDDLQWTELPSDSGTDILLSFPTAIEGGDQQLRIVALAPTVLETRWRLPRVSPIDVQWREGTFVASLSEDLELVEFEPVGMREIRAGPRLPTESDESHVMQLFSASATLDLQLRRRASDVSGVIATNLDAEPGTVSGTVSAEFRSRFGRQFVLEADVARDWIVDSLDIEPREALEDYELQSIGDRQLLRVKLADPITPLRPIKLFIACHRGGSTNMERDHFRPVVFRNLTDETRIVAINPDTLYQLNLTGDAELTRLDPETLPAEYASLVQARAGSVVFVDDASSLRLGAQLRRQNPEFRVSIDIDVVVADNTLTERYHVACRPESSRLDRLTVHVTGDRSDPIAWRMVAPDATALQARLIEPSEEMAAAPEVWELILGQPTDRPFEFVGVRQSLLSAENNIALASIPAALSQSGVVTVETAPGTQIQIQPRNVKPIPIEPASMGDVQQLRARYRFDPSKDASVQLIPRKVDARSGTFVWAWACDLTTRVDFGGRLWHEAVYRLENAGMAQVLFSLPRTAQIQSVDVNNTVTPTRPAIDGRPGFAIVLPPGRYPTIRIRYSTDGPSSGFVREIQAVLPEPSFKTLERRWTVWLPPGFRHLTERQDSWSRRLFGPFWRGDETRFGPLPLGDDLQLWNRSSRFHAEIARTAEAGESMAPWVAVGSDELSSGWIEAHVDLGGLETGRLVAYRTDGITAGAWSAMIMMAGLGVWLGRGHAFRLAPLITLWSVAALVIPAPVAPVVAGALWGTVLAAVAVAVFPPHRVELVGDSSSARSTVTFAGSAGAMGILAALLAGLPLGPTARADDEFDPNRESWVIVPIDEQRRVVGNHYYLPLELYDRLHRPSGQPGAWLIRSAAYRTDLNWDLDAGTKLESRELHASFRVEVFQPKQTVVIPLGGPETHVIGARLSGTPVLPVQPNPNQLAITVDQPGPYQLDVVLQPTPKSTDGHSSFELDVPPVSHCLVRIGFPEDASGIQLPTARGQSRIDPFTGELVFDHGPATTLRVEWPANQDGALHPPETRVDQLLWMHVRPHSVTVEARFDITVLDGELSRVSVVTDPRLRLIPLTADQPVSSLKTTVSGDRQTIEFLFDDPVTQSMSLHAEFLVAGTSGIGKLQVPSVEISGVSPIRRWMAVSVADELDYSAENTNLSDTLERTDFVTAWGTSPDVPDLTYRLPDETALWSLLTQPKKHQTTSSELMDVRAGSDGMEIIFRADLNTSNGSIFQHYLKVFDALRIQRALVTVGESEYPVRVSESRAGEYQLFFGREITGPYRLTLRAAIPLDDSAELLSIPTIRIREATVSREQIRVFRRPGLRVSVAASTGWFMQADQTAGEYREGLGRLVAVLDATPEVLGSEIPAGTLRIRPNRPRIDALTATGLDRISDRWVATSYYRVTNLAPEAGDIDQLRLEVPTEWDGPISVEPEASVEVVPIPGRSRKHLILRPHQPITDQALLVIRGTLTAEASQRVRAPDIIPLDVVSARRFLILPTQLQEQKIEWETSGLQESGIPAIARSDPANDDRFTAYRIMRAANPRASIADVQRVSGEPQISLADIVVSAAEDGHCFGVAKFDLEPAGLSHVDIECPQGIELVHTTAGGIPMTCVSQGGRRYRMALSADQLPQRIAVVFQGRTRRVRTSREFHCPTIREVPVVRTLWTVHAPANWRVSDKELTNHLVSPLRQGAIRLKSTSELVESASRTVMESPPSEILSWYAPWARRIAILQAKMVEHRAETDSVDPFDASIMDVVSQQQASIATRLNTTELWDQLVADMHRSGGPVEAWGHTTSSNGPRTYCAFLDSVSQLTLDESGPPLSNTTQRYLAAVVVVAGMILGALVVSLTRMGAWLANWPQTIGLGIGVIWWLVLTPGVLGLLVAAASVIGLVRQSLVRVTSRAGRDARVE